MSLSSPPFSLWDALRTATPSQSAVQSPAMTLGFLLRRVTASTEGQGPAQRADQGPRVTPTGPHPTSRSRIRRLFLARRPTRRLPTSRWKKIAEPGAPQGYPHALHTHCSIPGSEVLATPMSQWHNLWIDFSVSVCATPVHVSGGHRENTPKPGRTESDQGARVLAGAFVSSVSAACVPGSNTDNLNNRPAGKTRTVHRFPMLRRDLQIVDPSVAAARPGQPPLRSAPHLRDRDPSPPPPTARALSHP